MDTTKRAVRSVLWGAVVWFVMAAGSSAYLGRSAQATVLAAVAVGLVAYLRITARQPTTPVGVDVDDRHGDASGG